MTERGMARVIAARERIMDKERSLTHRIEKLQAEREPYDEKIRTFMGRRKRFLVFSWDLLRIDIGEHYVSAHSYVRVRAS